MSWQGAMVSGSSGLRELGRRSPRMKASVRTNTGRTRTFPDSGSVMNSHVMRQSCGRCTPLRFAMFALIHALRARQDSASALPCASANLRGGGCPPLALVSALIRSATISPMMSS
jgi:hypothetical protein